MSLLTSYSDANLVTSRALSIRYSTVKSSSGDFYEVTRTAAKSYSFIGMTYEAAMQCQSAKVAQYTRNYSRIEMSNGQPSNVSLKELQTDISPACEDGDAWRVDISVNETDVKYSATAPSDPAALFSSENARNYDGGTFSDALEVTAATATSMGMTISYTQDIRDFDRNRLTLQGKDTESGEWRAIAISNTTTSTVTTDNGDIPGFVRLLYGSYESNVLAVSTSNS